MQIILEEVSEPLKNMNKLSSFWIDPPVINFSTINAPLGAMDTHRVTYSENNLTTHCSEIDNKDFELRPVKSILKRPMQHHKSTSADDINTVFQEQQSFLSIGVPSHQASSIELERSSTSRISTRTTSRKSSQSLQPIQAIMSTKSIKTPSSSTSTVRSKRGQRKMSKTQQNSSVSTSKSRSDQSMQKSKSSLSRSVSPTPSGRWERLQISRNQRMSSTQRLAFYRKLVNEAIMQRKVYMVIGAFPGIRSEFIRRGWIEKLPGRSLYHLQNMPIQYLIESANYQNDAERMVLSKLLGNTPPSFIYSREHYLREYSYSMPLKSRIKMHNNYNFTAKDGFMRCVNNATWWTINNFSEIQTPRTYYLAASGERETFIDDFRRTACTSLISYIVNHPQKEELFSPKGALDLKYVDFAIRQIRERINMKDHYDIDLMLYNSNIANDRDWDEYINATSNAMRRGKHIRLSDPDRISKLLSIVTVLYKAALQYWPDIYADGYYNIWILKPTNWWQGIGITLWTKYRGLLEHADHSRRHRYIVQKYIEKPLLIFRTKFDIRNYLLLSVNRDATMLTAWFYKDCYLRFSSQEFDLEDLNESIHLTNYAVQKRYKISPNRNKRIPASNMWDLQTFKTHLANNGRAGIWEKRIYPTMKKQVNAIVLSAQDECDYERNSFELFGCDFMITAEYNTFLIEINHNPDLNPSTNVTRRICNAVMVDLVKALLDGKNYVGGFEKICQIQITRSSSAKNLHLRVDGKKFTPDPSKLQYLAENATFSAPSEEDFVTSKLVQKGNAVSEKLTEKEASKAKKETNDGNDIDDYNIDIDKDSELKLSTKPIYKQPEENQLSLLPVIKANETNQVNEQQVKPELKQLNQNNDEMNDNKENLSSAQLAEIRMRDSLVERGLRLSKLSQSNKVMSSTVNQSLRSMLLSRDMSFKYTDLVTEKIGKRLIPAIPIIEQKVQLPALTFPATTTIQQ